MLHRKCENCGKNHAQNEQECPHCGFPVSGSKKAKIAYNAKLMQIRDLVDDVDRSIQVVLSFSIIFLFMAVVVLAFTLLFDQGLFTLALFYLVAAKVYYLLQRLGRRSTYLMLLIAFLFYTIHTIFEFSLGIMPQTPVDLSDSFARSKGAALVFYAIPFAYLLVRFALIIVLLKYLYVQLRLRKNLKMVQFIKSEQSHDA